MSHAPAFGSADHYDHFDLGVDELATDREIGDMHDPWVGTQSQDLPAASHTALPDADISPWADSLQLPGVDA